MPFSRPWAGGSSPGASGVKVDLQTVIIGAGVIGAAVAYALRDSGSVTYVLEAEAKPATGISSRNSGVIHAGLYYPANSLKTRLCRRGAGLLYGFAESHGVPFQKTGKYLVANDPGELNHLAEIQAQAGAVPLLTPAEIPSAIRAKAALFSPNSGLVDVHCLTEALLSQSRAQVLFNQPVRDLKPEGSMVRFRVRGETFRAQTVVNCAGLVAADFTSTHRHHYAKGSYFRLSLPPSLEVPHLVYPAVPAGAPFLGIHLTRQLGGDAYLGPDLEWVEACDFSVDERRSELFFQAARRYLPWLKKEQLSPGYAGIRPKLDPNRFADFTFLPEGQRGQLIHCLGIESPGITAALAIGDWVKNLLYKG